MNVPVGVGAIVMCAMYLVPDGPRRESAGSIDWARDRPPGGRPRELPDGARRGASTDDQFESPFIATLAVFAVAGTALFVWRTLRSKAPVVDLRVLRYRSLWAGSLMSVVIGMGLYGTIFAVPIFAQSILDFTSQQTGLLLLPGAIASAVARCPSRRSCPRRVPDARILIAVGRASSSSGRWRSSGG